MNVLILGVNGFIGNALTHRITTTTDWHVYGMDLSSSKLEHSLGHPQFHFLEGDITINKEWIEYHVKKCDVVLPLVAIATPATYVKDPLRVFELDFEENLGIVRHCVKYRRRLVFPSTSEVYGMCPDPEFDEDSSPLVYGPIDKQRWIYACSKQLMDRVIAAYGQQRELKYSCFRPFNWIGPKLDDIYAAKEGSSRVLTQFIVNLVTGEPILLVDGGEQKRCFTWVEDGIDGLMRIIENPGGVCDGEIFNLGNPHNECSVTDLAKQLAAIHDAHSEIPPRVQAGPHRIGGRRGVLRQGVPGRGGPQALDRQGQPPPRLGPQDLARRGPGADLRRLPGGLAALRRRERGGAALMSPGVLGLRVDVDTHDGMRDGVPRLLEVMAEEGVKATFYFAMGPDRSGLAVLNALRPGFLRKMTRTSATQVYGWRTVLSGTLLPSRPIGTAFPEVARHVRDEGHETGVHAWDHRQWQDRLFKFPPEKTAARARQGFPRLRADLP